MVFADGVFIAGGAQDSYLYVGDVSNETLGDNETINAYQNMTWIDSIGAFFGSIVDAFGYVIDFLTFSTFRTTIASATEIPTWLMWLPALMVLPVWIAVIYWIAPFAIKAMQAIGNWIPFT